MNLQHTRHLRQTLTQVHEAVDGMELSVCDKDDMFELMERVDSELSSSHPNPQTVTMLLNSIARSLRNEPKARDLCLALDDAMKQSGVPSTWQQGL